MRRVLAGGVDGDCDDAAAALLRCCAGVGGFTRDASAHTAAAAAAAERFLEAQIPKIKNGNRMVVPTALFFEVPTPTSSKVGPLLLRLR